MGKETLNEFVQKHSLAKQMRQYKTDIVLEKFSNWLKSKPATDSWHNSLYSFATESPFCYFAPQTIDETLAILNTDVQSTIDTLKSTNEDTSKAIFTFFRPSASQQVQDEDRISIDTPKGIESFENIWHPEYIKYCEQIYNHLIKIPLDILGKQRKKDYISLKLPLRVERLTNFGYKNLTNGYDSVIRNAISHGGIEYEISDIRYIDIKDKKEVYAPDLVELLDDLSDTCSSIIAALLIFIIENQTAIKKAGVENLPLGLKFLLTNGFASHHGSKVISFIESGQNKQQLNINIKTNTTHRGVHQLESLQTAWAACFFGGRNFDRFLVSIDCNMPSQSLAIIDGKLLREAVENDTAFDLAAPKLFESSLLWYDTSQFNFRLYALQCSFKTNFDIQKRKFRMEMAQKGVLIPRLEYKIVFFKNTSPKRYRRIEANIVLDTSEEINETHITRIIKESINRIRQRLIKRKGISGEFGLPGFPFSVILRVFSANKRIRKLATYSWQHEELVAIAEFSKDWKICPPFFTKDPNRTLNRVRIKYNPKLIKIKP